MHIRTYIGFVTASEAVLRDAYLQVSARHEREADVRDGCRKLAKFASQRIESLRPMQMQFGSASTREPKLIRNAMFRGMRVGGIGLLRDLHDLSILANQVLLYWIALYQGFRALHESSAEAVCHDNILSIERELAWLTTHIKEASPQALTISPDRVTQAVTIAKKIPTTAVLPDQTPPSVIGAAVVAGAGLVGFVLGRRKSKG